MHPLNPFRAAARPDPRALVANPAAFDVSPAARASAWADLKAARGQPIPIDTLIALRPAYLTAAPIPAAPCGTVATIDATRARIAERMRVPGPFGGDAA